MTIAKLLWAPIIFFVALRLFLLAPASRAELLLSPGLDLKSHTGTVLSLMGMAVGVILARQTLAERRFANHGRPN